MGQAIGGVTDVVIGRKLWQEWSEYWQSAGADDPFGQFINPVRKHVVSSTLSGDLGWNSTVIEGDPVAHVQQLKDGGRRRRQRRGRHRHDALALPRRRDRRAHADHAPGGGSGSTAVRRARARHPARAGQQPGTAAGNAILVYRCGPKPERARAGGGRRGRHRGGDPARSSVSRPEARLFSRLGIGEPHVRLGLVVVGVGVGDEGLGVLPRLHGMTERHRAVVDGRSRPHAVATVPHLLEVGDASRPGAGRGPARPSRIARPHWRRRHRDELPPSDASPSLASPSPSETRLASESQTCGPASSAVQSPGCRNSSPAATSWFAGSCSAANSCSDCCRSSSDSVSSSVVSSSGVFVRVYRWRPRRTRNRTPTPMLPQCWARTPGLGPGLDRRHRSRRSSAGVASGAAMRGILGPRALFGGLVDSVASAGFAGLAQPSCWPVQAWCSWRPP